VVGVASWELAGRPLREARDARQAVELALG